MSVDYCKISGAESLYPYEKRVRHGSGVEIAILDSGEVKKGAVGRFSTNLNDPFGHALAVSSILFGGGGVRGVCEGAWPHFIKVLDENGNGSIRSVSDGINAAVDRGVSLINLSLGFTRTSLCPSELKKACRRAYDAGITIVCAAGNDGGRVNWPAALETTICVGSSSDDGLKASFSNVGEVDFVAPGVQLPVLGKYGDIKRVSGTSFSAAIVSGVAAWCIAHLKNRQRHFTVEDVRRELRTFARDVDREGWDAETGYGQIARFYDSTVSLKIERGFFGKLMENIYKLFA